MGKQSAWEKPLCLKSPTERLLAQCPWKEYTSDTGKVYYHNTQTKESVWSIPPELASVKEKIKIEEAKEKIIMVIIAQKIFQVTKVRLVNKHSKQPWQQLWQPTLHQL